ncbi:hypothetical protein GQP67_004621, partial [Salmonella enterica]|nr:hypothetical protein [Salmonella enterica]
NGGGSAGKPVQTLQPSSLALLGKNNLSSADNKTLCLSCLMDAAMNGTPIVLRGN